MQRKRLKALKTRSMWSVKNPWGPKFLHVYTEADDIQFGQPGYVVCVQILDPDGKLLLTTTQAYSVFTTRTPQPQQPTNLVIQRISASPSASKACL